jgi:hypothetical protein
MGQPRQRQQHWQQQPVTLRSSQLQLLHLPLHLLELLLVFLPAQALGVCSHPLLLQQHQMQRPHHHPIQLLLLLQLQLIIPVCKLSSRLTEAHISAAALLLPIQQQQQQQQISCLLAPKQAAAPAPAAAAA